MAKFLTSLLPQPRTTIAGKIQIPSPTDQIHEYSSTSLELLTQLLCRVPGPVPLDSSEPWFRDQATLMRTFPPCLLHPKSSGIIPRLAATISSIKLGETGAILCTVHKPLNPYLIRKIFLELTYECTTRLRHLATASTIAGELPRNVRELVARMQMLNSIWMDPELYRQAYQVSPTTPRYERVASGCEACILATIGGNRNIVRDLYASILGRRKKNGRMEEGWIDVVMAWGSWHKDFDALTFESTGLGREIGRCRKHLQTLRRAAIREQLGGVINPFERDSEAQTLLGRDSLEEDKYEEDFENEIVDFYANMMSRTSLGKTTSDLNLHPAESVHPAFRNTVIFTGGFFQNALRPVQKSTQSIYSRSEYENSQTSVQGAEERANAYRKLVGIEENDDEDVLQFTNPFADENVSGYRGTLFENPRASPAPPSPRAMISKQENQPKHKPAPHHRLPKPQVNPFVRSHVAHPEGKHSDRETRFSDFMQ
ncbi:hypothetical protein NHQ30_005527 [Ciborinia camelliae]|nr:hypothetical protein NHQ30_005527 [Ciborinia camelliae]